MDFVNTLVNLKLTVPTNGHATISIVKSTTFMRIFPRKFCRLEKLIPTKNTRFHSIRVICLLNQKNSSTVSYLIL